MAARFSIAQRDGDWSPWLAIPSRVVVAKYNGAVAALRGSDPLTELGQIVVHVDDIAFSRSAGGLIVPTGIQGDPSTAEIIDVADLIPRQALANGPTRRTPCGAGRSLWRCRFSRT
jgi:hypothetical protein